MSTLPDRAGPRFRLGFRQQLLLILLAGAAIRALLIAVHPGEYADLNAINVIGYYFDQSPLHLYLLAPHYTIQGMALYDWPYPPAFLPVTGLLHSLSFHLGAAVSRTDRVLVSIADLAMAWVMQAGLGRLGRPDRERLIGAALIALGPTFFAVSGTHGQLDAVAWLPAIAGVLLWERRRHLGHVAVTGALIGLGIAIKTVPVVALLGLLPAARSRREAAVLLASTAAMAAAWLAPFALVSVHALTPIASYRGFPGRAGLAVLLQPSLAVELMRGRGEVFDATTHFLVNDATFFLVPILAVVWLLARRRGLGAADTISALMLGVYVFAPAVLPQYWMWIVPFLIIGRRYRAAGLFQVMLLAPLAIIYTFLSEPWDKLTLAEPLILYGYMPLIWAITLVMFGALIALLAPAQLIVWVRAIARRHLAAAGRRLRAAPRHRWGLVAILLAGGGLRLWLLVADRPAFLGYPDSRAYIAAVNGPLFWNPYKPAGYPIMLRVLRTLDPHLSGTIVVQHLLGLLTVVLIYLATVRFLRRGWLALLPAAVVAFSGTQLYLEHAVLSDGPFALAIAGALWCACATITPGRWGPRATAAALAGAGALIGVATVLRPVGLALIAGLLVWALARHAPAWRARLTRTALCALGCAVVLVPYLIAAHAATGQWGLTRASGEQLYGRIATFADCRDFRPPAGTRALCPRAPGPQRPDANWYLFDAASPLVRHYGTPGPYNPFDPDLAHYRYPPERLLSAFDRAALEHQPLDFLVTTLQGMVKYVAPHAGPARMLEWDTSTLISQLHNPGIEADTDRYVVGAYHTPAGYLRRDLAATDAYASSARVEGLPTAVLLVLMLCGWFWARGPARSAGLLLGGAALLLALAPVAALFYSARYATPAYGPLAASAAIGVDVLVIRARDRWSGERARRGGRAA